MAFRRKKRVEKKKTGTIPFLAPRRWTQPTASGGRDKRRIHKSPLIGSEVKKPTRGEEEVAGLAGLSLRSCQRTCSDEGGLTQREPVKVGITTNHG